MNYKKIILLFCSLSFCLIFNNVEAARQNQSAFKLYHKDAINNSIPNTFSIDNSFRYNNNNHFFQINIHYNKTNKEYCVDPMKAYSGGSYSMTPLPNNVRIGIDYIISTGETKKLTGEEIQLAIYFFGAISNTESWFSCGKKILGDSNDINYLVDYCKILRNTYEELDKINNTYEGKLIADYQKEKIEIQKLVNKEITKESNSSKVKSKLGKLNTFLKESNKDIGYNLNVYLFDRIIKSVLSINNYALSFGVELYRSPSQFYSNNSVFQNLCKDKSKYYEKIMNVYNIVKDTKEHITKLESKDYKDVTVEFKSITPNGDEYNTEKYSYVALEIKNCSYLREHLKSNNSVLNDKKQYKKFFTIDEKDIKENIIKQYSNFSDITSCGWILEIDKPDPGKTVTINFEAMNLGYSSYYRYKSSGSQNYVGFGIPFSSTYYLRTSIPPSQQCKVSTGKKKSTICKAGSVYDYKINRYVFSNKADCNTINEGTFWNISKAGQTIWKNSINSEYTTFSDYLFSPDTLNCCSDYDTIISDLEKNGIIPANNDNNEEKSTNDLKKELETSYNKYCKNTYKHTCSYDQNEGIKTDFLLKGLKENTVKDEADLAFSELHCCDDFANETDEFYKKIPADKIQEWTKYYNQYCDGKKKSDECSIENDGKTIKAKNGKVYNGNDLNDALHKAFSDNKTCCNDGNNSSSNFYGSINDLGPSSLNTLRDRVAYDCQKSSCVVVPNDDIKLVSCCDNEEPNVSYIKEPSLDRIFTLNRSEEEGEKITNVKINENFCTSEDEERFKSSYENVTGDSDINKNYCEMYCNEEVEISLPKYTTSISGRYFKFEPNEYNKVKAKGPIIYGKRNCRSIIQYDKFYKDMVNYVKEEASKFNNYQEALTKFEEIDKYTKTESTIQTADIYECWKYVEEEESCTDEDTDNEDCWKKDSEGQDVFKEDGTTHEVDTTKKKKVTNYKKVDDERVTDSDGNVILETYITETYTLFNPSAQYATVKAVNNNLLFDELKTIKGLSTVYKQNIKQTDFKCKEGAKRELKKDSDGNSLKEIDYITYYDNAKANVESAKNTAYSSYESAINNINNLTKALSKCTNKDGDNTDKLKEIYNLEPEVKFSYFQPYYSNDNKTEIISEDYVYEQKNDQIQQKYNETNCQSYVSNTCSITEDYNIFNNVNSTSYRDASSVNNALSNQKYSARNIYRLDFNIEKTIPYETSINQDMYTIYTNGITIKKELGNFDIYNNKTQNSNLLYTYLTTYEGKFETKWNITNIGHNGRLDSKIDEYEKAHPANTCSGSTVSGSDNRFTCYIKNKSQLFDVGSCVKDYDKEKVINQEEASNPEICKNKLNTDIYFKVINPLDPFPNIKNNVNYAKNWIKRVDKGIITPKSNVYTKIVKDAKDDKTYSEDNKTYSVTLTSSDMKLIKKYNKSRNVSGGYNDGDTSLTCVCSNNINTEVNSTGSCDECKSSFISNLFENKIIINNEEKTINGTWNNSTSLCKDASEADPCIKKIREYYYNKLPRDLEKLSS